MGGIRSLILALLAKNLWEWCLECQIVLEDQHILGILNIEADRESQIFADNNDWKLASQVFDNLNQVWWALEVDLFATRVKTTPSLRELETSLSMHGPKIGANSEATHSHRSPWWDVA